MNGVRDVVITVTLRGRLYGDYDREVHEDALSQALAVRHEAPYQAEGVALIVNEVHAKVEQDGVPLGWTIARLQKVEGP